MATKKQIKKTTKMSDKPKASPAKAAVDTSSPRLRKLSRRTGKKLAKKSVRSTELPSAWIILKNSLTHLYTHKKLFLGILLVYGLLNMLFVRGISANFQLATLRQSLSDSLGSDPGKLGSGVALFGLLLGSGASTNNEAAGAYQTCLIIITSLALIWALRHTYANATSLRIRDAFYKSMQPLIPFTLIAFVIILQLIPFLITASLYSTIQSGGLAASGIEQLLWLVVLMLGFGISLYFISSSIFALYIVTLPDAQPRASLRSARKLVRLRRLIIIRKIVFLPVILLFVAAVVLIPLIIFVAPAAEILFMIFTIFTIGIIHSYYYSLYRSLL